MHSRLPVLNTVVYNKPDKEPDMLCLSKSATIDVFRMLGQQLYRDRACTHIQDMTVSKNGNTATIEIEIRQFKGIVITKHHYIYNINAEYLQDALYELQRHYLIRQY